jgi:uncharacterized protein (DUF927 family)
MFDDDEDEDFSSFFGNGPDPNKDLPSDFRFSVGKLCYFAETQSGVNRIELCQQFQIVARVSNEHGKQPGTMIAWTDERGIAHDYVVLDSVIHACGSPLVSNLSDNGLRCEHGSSDLLKKFFSRLTATKFITTFDRAGWQREGADFLLPNGDHFGCGAEAIYVNRNQTKNRLAGELADWQKNVVPLTIGNSRLVMSLGAAFVGPLIDIAGEEFSAFHFVGSSSIGKSTAAYLAASVWGQPSPYDQIRSWRATDNGLEGVASDCTDTILVLDEMGQIDPKAIGECVYMLANGAGKARASRDGSAREIRKWRLSVISTGEHTVEQALKSIGRATAGGLDVRMINIPGDAGAGMGMFQCVHGKTPAVFADSLKAACAENYGAAGRAFVAKLVELRSADEIALASLIAARCKAFIDANMPAGADGQIARVLRKFAIAAVAGELAAEWGIVPLIKDTFNDGVAECATAWLARRGGTGPKEEIDVIARCRDFILTHGASRFENLDNADDEDARKPVVHNRAGWIKDGKYHFTTGAFSTEISKTLDKGVAISVLHKAGHMLQTVSESKRFGGAKIRVYVVEPTILDSE